MKIALLVVAVIAALILLNAMVIAPPIIHRWKEKGVPLMQIEVYYLRFSEATNPCK